MRDDFACFILSHGRPDNVKTLRTLERHGYTGKTYIIIDNEDRAAGEYYKRYGDMVVMFDKLEQSKKFDTADNFNDRRAVVYARNACWDIAERLGLKYFLQLDDDYTAIHYRKVVDDKLAHFNANADALFDEMLRLLEATGALTVALAQGGDFIGGKDSKNYKKGILRKAMNTFFCKTENRFDFVGRVNEDVNTYTTLGMRGERIFTTVRACINQVVTQQAKGGMSEMYLDSGTYIKSFYTVMMAPSCVKITMMGESHKRLHHCVNWETCVPKILRESVKKT